jgi:hypothetical protein
VETRDGRLAEICNKGEEEMNIDWKFLGVNIHMEVNKFTCYMYFLIGGTYAFIVDLLFDFLVLQWIYSYSPLTLILTILFVPFLVISINFIAKIFIVADEGMYILAKTN